jgi:pimeloyl-ACP methyl ester carboxylesterase
MRFLIVLAVGCVAAVTVPARGDGPRRVYVLHAGVHIYFSHPWKNHAAEVLRDELLRRKVSARDIVVLDNPFPAASWKDLVPKEGVTMFLDAMDPAARFSQEAYLRLHESLTAAGVGADDEIVWIGHSAGGQIGMTLAHLSGALERHPALAKRARPYRFASIVTLGTPVGANHVPEGVQVRHYYSPHDKIVRIVCDAGPWLLPSLGYKRTLCPCTTPPGPNCKVRCWYDVDHPDWIWERRVLDRVFADLDGRCASAWQEPVPTTHAGGMLPQLVARMLESQERICLEELP